MPWTEECSKYNKKANEKMKQTSQIIKAIDLTKTGGTVSYW